MYALVSATLLFTRGQFRTCSSDCYYSVLLAAWTPLLGPIVSICFLVKFCSPSLIIGATIVEGLCFLFAVYKSVACAVRNLSNSPDCLSMVPKLALFTTTACQVLAIAITLKSLISYQIADWRQTMFNRKRAVTLRHILRQAYDPRTDMVALNARVFTSQDIPMALSLVMDEEEEKTLRELTRCAFQEVMCCGCGEQISGEGCRFFGCGHPYHQTCFKELVLDSSASCIVCDLGLRTAAIRHLHPELQNGILEIDHD